MSETATIDPLTDENLNVLAERLAERLKPVVTKADYELIAFTIIGQELRATVRTPSGDVYQGVVTDWQRVKVVEVPAK